MSQKETYERMSKETCSAILASLYRERASKMEEKTVVVTLTVNVWRIKENETGEGPRQPVLCLNRYEWVRSGFNKKTGKVWRKWGPKVGETEHWFDLDIPESTMIYDPINKTPCGASCWAEWKEKLEDSE